MLIIGNKVSLVEQTTGKQKFETTVANAQRDGTALDGVLDIVVRKGDHKANVKQTEPQYGLEASYFTLNTFILLSIYYISNRIA